MRRGLLLTNLGTPNSCDIPAVKAYLREFLTDKRVIDIPAVFRYLLVYGLIVPFRAKKSAHAYQSIWTNHGSPLLTHSQNLAQKMQQHLGADYKVVLGMRYGNPSLKTALAQLGECDHITILPLYPQYSSAATGSSIAALLHLLQDKEVMPSLAVIRDFYQHPAYIRAQARLIKEHLSDHEHILFSYHGIPERHIHKSGCKAICPGVCSPLNAAQYPGCYKGQCYQTTSLLTAELKLAAAQYSTAFQSRLGKTPWIKPYTDEILNDLALKGIKKLAITCPSFVADCLETLEEIGIRAKEQWFALGGTQLTMIPCLNEEADWVQAIGEIVGASS